MKIVSVSLFTDFSQFHFIGNVKWDSYPRLIKGGEPSFYNPPTGHLHNDALLLLRQNPSGFYFFVKIRAFVI